MHRVSKLIPRSTMHLYDGWPGVLGDSGGAIYVCRNLGAVETLVVDLLRRVELPGQPHWHRVGQLS